MSTEETKPSNGETTNEQTATDAANTADASASGGAAENAPASSNSAPATGGGAASAPSPNSAASGASAATAPASSASPDAPTQDAPTPDTKTSGASPDAPSSGASTAGASPGMSDDDDDDDDDARGGGGDFDFGAMLDQYEQEQAAFQEGSVVRGTVVGVNERAVVIDFGFKSEGIVPLEEFTEAGELTVKRGDEVEVLIKAMESQEGVPILSRADAVRMRAWDVLEEAYRAGTPVKGRIVERVKGGLRVDVDGVAAFLPGSQVDIRPVRNLEALRNQEIEAKVIKLNRKRSNVVLSRKAILEEENEGRKGQTLNQLEESIIVEGQIKNLTDYGAFVDLGGIDGLLHVTDMSWGRLQNPAELFRVGENVQVKVLKFDKDRERVSLGYKQLQPDPWESVEERYPSALRLQGKIASVTDYGAFIELEPGVEGLVHVSEMTWSKRMKHPSKIVNVGDTVDVEVLGVDPKARRISLGMKQTQPNPWESLRDRYHIGDRVSGRVRNLTDFGAFVEVEDGVDGLVHVSDISWNKRIKHPGEVLKKGQEINAVITNIDTENRRLSLSIKDTEPSAWDKFINEHKPGDIVHGRVTRFANFGAFVELAEGLEGLCHVSELSDDRVDKPEDAAQIGQEMDFRILRIEQESKKIGLSARAAKHDEPVMDAKSYTSDVGGGMASLGELADFFPRKSEEPVNEPPAAQQPDAQPSAESSAGPSGESSGQASAEPPDASASEPQVESSAASSSEEPAVEASAESSPEPSAASSEESSVESPGAASGESEGGVGNG